MLKINLKKFLFDRPIKEKVGATILVVLASIFVFNVVFIPTQQKRTAIEKMRSKGELTVRMLAYKLSPVMKLNDLKSVDETVKGTFHDVDLFYVMILRYQNKDTLFYSLKKQVQHISFIMPTIIDTTVLSFTDEDHLTVISPIREGQQTIGMLMLSYSLEELKKEIAENRMWIIGLNFLMLMGGVIIAGYLSSIFTKPIRKLIGVAFLLARGEWGAQVPVEHKDEIGTLASTFNQMSRTLKESKEKLEEYGQTLEQKVEERTRELKRANEELSVNGETITRMLDDLNSMNRELARTKNQLENIFKSVIDRAIITVNTEGRIIFYSKSSELVFGYEAFEVVGKKYIDELFSPQNDFLPIFLEHTREAGIYKGETELLRRSQEVFPAMLVITPLKGEGGGAHRIYLYGGRYHSEKKDR